MEIKMSKEVLKKNLNFLLRKQPEVFKLISANLPLILNSLEVRKDRIIFNGQEIPLFTKVSFSEKIGIYYPQWSKKRKALIEYLEKYSDKVSEIIKKNATYFIVLGTLPNNSFFEFLNSLRIGNYPRLKKVFFFEENPEFLYLFLSSFDLSMIDGEIVFINKKEVLERLIDSALFVYPHFYYFYNYKSETHEALLSYSLQFWRRLHVVLTVEDFFNEINHSLTNFRRSNGSIVVNFKSDRNLSKVPAVIVGSGPSLDYSFDFLKAIETKAFIANLGSALRALVFNKIEPDLVGIIDRMKNQKEKIFQGIKEKDVEKSILVSVLGIDPNLVTLFKRVFFFGKSFLYPLLVPSPISHIFSHPSILNYTFEFLVRIGFRRFILVGVDLGTKEKGKGHTGFYIGGDIEYTIKVPGNFGGTVYTKHDFYFAKEILEEQIEHFKKEYPELVVFNVSDGAAIKGTAAISKKDLLKILSKENAINKEAIKQSVSFNLNSLLAEEFAFNGNRVYLKKNFSKFVKDVEFLLSASSYSLLERIISDISSLFKASRDLANDLSELYFSLKEFFHFTLLLESDELPEEVKDKIRLSFRETKEELEGHIKILKEAEKLILKEL